MKMLVVVHLLLVGVWLGCVLTEALFERALLGKGRTQELILVGLHRRVDWIVELPALSGVLLTGVGLLAGAGTSSVLHTKIVFALLAIAANVYCFWLVLRRARAATKGDWSQFEALDRLQHKWGAVVLIGILSALGLGVRLLVVNA
jgi:hypothetical protein